MTGTEAAGPSIGAAPRGDANGDAESDDEGLAPGERALRRSSAAASLAAVACESATASAARLSLVARAIFLARSTFIFSFSALAAMKALRRRSACDIFSAKSENERLVRPPSRRAATLARSGLLAGATMMSTVSFMVVCVFG